MVPVVLDQLHEVSAIQQYPCYCPLNLEPETIEAQSLSSHASQVGWSCLVECCFVHHSSFLGRSAPAGVARSRLADSGSLRCREDRQG